MNISTKEPILNLEGVQMKDSEGKGATVGNVIAGILLGGKTEFDVLKAYDLGTRFYRDKEVTLDDPDSEKLIKVVTDSDQPSVLVKGRILGHLKPKK